MKKKSKKYLLYFKSHLKYLLFMTDSDTTWGVMIFFLIIYDLFTLINSMYKIRKVSRFSQLVLKVTNLHKKSKM